MRDNSYNIFPLHVLINILRNHIGIIFTNFKLFFEFKSLFQCRPDDRLYFFTYNHDIIRIIWDNGSTYFCIQAFQIMGLPLFLQSHNDCNERYQKEQKYADLIDSKAGVMDGIKGLN